ncbi:MAG: N-acyl homoserine lactonase family protein [candidate division NC10 bacterium]|nr:N-acyl homoserine lactonase family protein [candidate division NC10 bacterium]
MGQTRSGESTPDIRLYCMGGGTLTFDQSVFTHMRGMGTLVEVPTPIVLILHPKGMVLFESGLHPAVATDPEGHWGQRAVDWKPRMTPGQSAAAQVASLGVDPAEISYVILSCLIPDHAGGMQAFPTATFVVQFQELQDAWWPDRRFMRSYDFGELLPTRDFAFWELYGEDLDLFGDGSVMVLSTPAHTRGEQALVVRLPRTGTMMFPAGVFPQRMNYDENIMTGTPRVAPSVVHASMRRLKALAQREGALLIFHHDPEEWKTVRLAPQYYD